MIMSVDGQQGKAWGLRLATLFSLCLVVLAALVSLSLSERRVRELALELSLQEVWGSLPALSSALEGWSSQTQAPAELSHDLALVVYSLVMREIHHLPVTAVVVVYPDGSAVIPDAAPALPDLSSDPLWLSSALRGYKSVWLQDHGTSVEIIAALPLERRDGSLVGGVLLRLDASSALNEQQIFLRVYRWCVGAGFGVVFLIVLAICVVFWRARGHDRQLLVREGALRRHMEESISALSCSLQDITGPLPAMIARVDHRQHYVFATAEYCRWFGTFGTSSVPVGTNLLAGENFEFHLGENYAQVSDLVVAALDGLSAVSEGVWSFPDGVRCVRVELQPVFERAAVRGFFISITDITAMKRLERDLRNARDRMEEEFTARTLEHKRTVESRLAEALDRVSEGFLLWDSQDCLLICNQAFRLLFPSLTKRVVPGIHYAEVVALLDALEQPVSVASASDGHDRDPGDASGQRSRPRERCFRDSLWVLMTETRTPEGLTVMTFTDISERKAAELALLSSEADLRELHKISSDPDQGMAEKVPALLQLGCKRFDMTGACLARCQGDVLISDYVVGRHDDLKVGQVVSCAGMSLSDVLEGQEILVPSCTQEETGQACLAVRVVACRRTWGILFFRGPGKTGHCLQPADLEFARLLALWIGARITHVETETHLRAALEQADAASRSKSLFLANMSHELRTPLNAIIGFSDVMASEILGTHTAPQYKDYSASIKESGQHLLSIINDILDTAKVEAGHLTLDDDVIKPVDLIDGTIRLLQGQLSAAGLTMRTDIPSDLLSIRGDARRLRQVLLNLLSNAIKFTPSGGVVTVTALYPSADGMTITVSDNGIGMRIEDIAVAMAPFGQIDSSLSRRHQGTGLGLPLSRSLVEAHGGTLSLVSAPGKGTEVRVWLPPDRLVQGA